MFVVGLVHLAAPPLHGAVLIHVGWGPVVRSIRPYGLVPCQCYAYIHVGFLHRIILPHLKKRVLELGLHNPHPQQRIFRRISCTTCTPAAVFVKTIFWVFDWMIYLNNFFKMSILSIKYIWIQWCTLDLGWIKSKILMNGLDQMDLKTCISHHIGS